MSEEVVPIDVAVKSVIAQIYALMIRERAEGARAGAQAEREACAELVGNAVVRYEQRAENPPPFAAVVAIMAADLIRARGESDG